MPQANIDDRFAIDDALPCATHADQGALRLDRTDARFKQDPERLCQVLIVAATDGLYVDREALAGLRQAAPALVSLTARQRGELLLTLLLSPKPADTVDLAVRAGVIGQIVPDMDRLRAMPVGHGRYKDVYSHTLRVLSATPSDLVTRLAALLHDIAKPDTLVIEGTTAHFPNHDLVGADRAARRLRGLGFGDETVGSVATLVRLHLRANSYEPSWTDSAVRRLHLEAGADWARLLALSYADVTSARSDVVARAHRRVHELSDHARSLERPTEAVPLDGNELMERLQRGPGRWIGEVKQHLLELVRVGELAAGDKERAWRAVDGFLAAESGEASSAGGAPGGQG